MKRIWNIFTTVFVVLIVTLAVLLAGVRAAGLTPYKVLSGSMVPKYPVGSLIYVKKVNASEVRVGDAITFVLNKNLVVATHEVYKIDKENQCFYTEGIANKDENGNIQKDANPVLFHNLIGKPVFCVPFLGYASQFFATSPGMYILIGFIALLIFMTFYTNIKAKFHKRGSNERVMPSLAFNKPE